jgi:uncharacterized protein YegP (UPF0339 family)
VATAPSFRASGVIATRLTGPHRGREAGFVGSSTNDAATHREHQMAHKFLIKKNKAGEFVAYFVYNSETIFWTEGYASKASAKNAIESIKKNGPDAPTEDLSDA